MKKLLSVVSVLTALGMTSVGFVGVASACSWAGEEPFPADRQVRQDEPPVETTFPDPVTLELLVASRDSDLTSGDSCRPTGIIKIGVSYDDTTDYGLLWKIVEGTSPPSSKWPTEAVQAETSLYMRWGENKDILQKTYDFQMTATWVDAWGREGNPSEPLLIHVPAAEVTVDLTEPEVSDDMSCSHSGSSNPAQSALVFAGLGMMALVVRRKVF